MPQGGIDEGEDPWATALRELEEETGIRPHLVERIADCPERLRYDLPEDWRRGCGAASGSARSRTGSCAASSASDSDVNIATAHPEFREWKWVEPERLPDLIVPFKRDLYRRLLAEFGDYLR